MTIHVPHYTGGHITGREREIIGLVAQAMTDAQIATQLGTDLSTVKNQMASIRVKLRQPNRVGVVVEAIRRGWVEVKA
jgi:DNA-binding CsgD family transcriptional regulator